jgi:calcineurin-like phosphoesterase family protein
MENIYFTSDLHFNHSNIITKSHRPFESIEEMNSTIIDNWNRAVRSEDKIYVLGDFCWKKCIGVYDIEKIFSILNGKKHLIIGNHDFLFVRKLNWEWVKDYYRLKYDISKTEKYRFILFHYPIEIWDGCRLGEIHLHGHIHSKINNLSNYKKIDVGVEANNYTPIHIDQIIELCKNKIDMMDYHHII